VRNKEDAEEIVQDVLLRVHRSVGEFRGDAALSSWIYRITFNAAMSRVRSGAFQRAKESQRLADAAHQREELGVKPATEPIDPATLADERIFTSQLRHRLYRAILALPVIYRAPIMLRDIQGLSTEEASAFLHVKDQTLKSRLHRGRLILRKQLADFADGLSLHRPIYGT